MSIALLSDPLLPRSRLTFGRPLEAERLEILIGVDEVDGGLPEGSEALHREAV
jgi:hypothetical protein